MIHNLSVPNTQYPVRLHSTFPGPLLSIKLSPPSTPVPIGPQRGQVERGRFASEQLGDQLAGDRRQAQTHHGVAGGEQEIVVGSDAAEVGQAVG